MRDDNDPTRETRRRLQRDTLTGFLSFFAVVSVIQAILNLFAPEPAVWPAALALVLVVLTVVSWRSSRK
ncbi:hypothetical protein FRX94_04165 [Corynebacterium canis]|uniref:Uncharacterized protein n=1 Tax=Corynebacterium canis TaxID=679663 RepID=A0A5C5UM90_9CORY|nr:hypothetical protein [Corynebacterium canis]TWT26802.1 hypothetical protein FRX94_04165 [Corynebacterium canis]WJY74485.1 hypothetical protein CCANI_03140 [Corynebacterium canis]